MGQPLKSTGEMMIKIFQWMLLPLCLALIMCARAAGEQIDMVATIVSLRGDVEIWNAADGVWMPAREGALIKTGGKARTKQGAECSIKWLKGNMMKLHPDSELEVKKLSMNPEKGLEESSLIVNRGKVFLKANAMTSKDSSFTVKARSSTSEIDDASIVIGVRDASKTSVECLDSKGRVTVHGTTGAPVSLSAGWKTRVSESGIPEIPAQMTGAEWQSYADLMALIPAAEPAKRKGAAPSLVVIQPQGTFSVDGGSCVRQGSAIRCTVTGFTDPGVKLLINGINYRIADDGSFSQEILLDPYAAAIEVSAENDAGERTFALLSRDLTQAAYLELTATPSQVVANGVNTVALSVRALNFMNEPVNGGTVTLFAGSGSVTPASVVITGGAGAAVFTPPLASADTTVTITAISGGLTDTAAITVLGDFPPMPERR